MKDEFEQYYEWAKQFDNKIVNFNDGVCDGNTEHVFYKGFKPFLKGRTELIEDCDYVTIRCGLNGIYTVLNKWKNGTWIAKCLDNSSTIAYRELKSYEEFKFKS